MLLNMQVVIGQDSVSAWFIGSHGYLLESPDKKVALDALIYWEGNNWGYICPPYEVNQKMEAAAPPFDSIDLILIGHAHSDHYNPETVERSMLKNPDARLVTTPGVRNAIASSVDSFSYYSDRIWAPDVPFNHSIDSVISDIPITISCIPHGSENMDLFIFSFVVNNLRFLHLNSWNSLTTADYDTMGFNRERADVGFICYDYIMNQTKLDKFINNIHPVFTTISHVDGATPEKLNSIEEVIATLKDEYPMNMLSSPMEQLLYIKSADTVLVDTLNWAPIFNQEIEDLDAVVDVPFSMTLPPDIAYDPEGGPVAYTLTRTSGELPAWLSFDEETLEISGTPEESGNISLKFIATDTLLAARYQVFRIYMTSPDALKENNSGVLKIYPIPARDKITISFGEVPGKKVFIELYDIQGELVLSDTLQNANVATIDLTNHSKGVYLLRLITDSEIICKTVYLV